MDKKAMNTINYSKKNSKTLKFSFKYILTFLFFIILSSNNIWGQQNYTWTGNTDTNWDTLTNWSIGTSSASQPPSKDDTVTITAPATNYPIISSSKVTIKTLTIDSNATLTIEQNATLTIGGGKLSTLSQNNGAIKNNGTLKIKGNFEDIGTYSGTGTININASKDQIIKLKDNTIYPNIEISKSNGTLTFTSPLNVTTLTDTASTDIIFEQATKITNNVAFNTKDTITINATFEAPNIEIPNGTLFLNSIPPTPAQNQKAAIQADTIKLKNVTITGEVFISGKDLTKSKVSLENITKAPSSKIENTLQINNCSSVTISENINSITDIIITASTINFSNKQNTSITTTRNQIYKGTVNLSALSTTFSTDSINGTIKFLDKIIGNNNNNITLTNTKEISISKEITKIKDFLVDSSVTSTTLPNNILTTGNQTYNGEINFTTGPTTLTANDFTINNSFNLSDNTTLNIFGDFINNGTINSNTKKITINLKGKPTNLKTKQTFKDTKNQYDEIFIDTSKANNKEVPVIFEGILKTHKISTSSDYNGEIDFNCAGLITDAVNLTTSGIVSFSIPKNSIFEIKKTFERSNGKTLLSGTIQTNGSQTYNSSVELNGNTTLLAPTQNIFFGSSIAASKNTSSPTFTIGETSHPINEIQLEKGIGTNTEPINQIEIYANNISLKGNVYTENNQSYHGPINLSSTTLNTTTLNSSNGIISFENNIIGSKTTDLTINASKINLPEKISANTIILAKDSKNYPLLLLATNGTSLEGNSITLSDNINSENSTLSLKLNGSLASLNFLDSTNIDDTTNSIAKIKSFTQTGTGTINIAADIQTMDTVDGISFSKTSPIKLIGNVSLNGNKIDIGNTITGENYILLMGDSSSPVNQDVSLPKDISIKSISIFSKGTITLPTNVTTTGDQTYSATTTISIPNSPTILKGAKITLDDNIENESLDLKILNSDLLTFNDKNGIDDIANFAKLKSFTQSGKGAINIAADIKTTENISFSNNAPITLTGNVCLNGTTISVLNGNDVSNPSSIDGAFDLIIGDSLNSITTDVTLSANIGDTQPLKKLDITTTNATLPKIISADTIILAKDTKNYPTLSLDSNGTALKGNKITLSDNINSSSSALSVELTDSGEFNFLDKTDVDANDTTQSIATLASFTHTQKGNGTVNLSADIKTSEGIAFSKNAPVTLTGNVFLDGKTISNASSINGAYNFIIGNSSNLTTNNVTINANIGDVEPLALLEINALDNIDFPLNVTNIKTTDNQTYNGKVSFKDVSISTKTALNPIDIMFTKTASADNLTLDIPKGKVTFKDKLTLSKTLIDTAQNKYNLYINNGGSTKQALILLTTGIVTINDAKEDIFTVGESTTTPKYEKFTHTEGLTNIKGTLNANDIALTKTNIEGTINANDIKSGETTFSGFIFANTVLFGENKENISLAGYIQTKNNQTYNGNTSLTRETKLEISPITPSVDPYPYITFTENSSLNVDKNLLLEAHSLYKGNDITSNTGSIIANNHDFIIQSENKNVTLSSDIISNYFILDVSKLGNNTFTINNNITTNKDLVIYGSSFCTTDQESGNTDIYVYDSYTSPVKPVLPVSSTQSNPPSSFAETISIDKNITLESKGNLYINGANITTSPSAKLTLKFPSNFNTISTYAQSFYSDFSAANATISTPSKSKLVTEACKLDDTKQNYDTGWDSKPFIITKAYTVDDNVICIEFDREIRQISDNKKNGLSQQNGNRISYTKNSNNQPYENVIFKENKTNGFDPLPITNNISKDTSLNKIYLASYDTWNTDATALEFGNGTDKDGKHITNILPTIDIKRNSNEASEPYNYFITDMFGKRLTHYSDNTLTGTKKYTKNELADSNGIIPPYDQCSPVILSVSTGQEFHNTDPKKWTSYDSHNFIEFCYSEDVTIGDAIDLNPDIMSYDTLAPVNIDPTAVIGNITNNSDGFTIKGLGTIERGAIKTGTKDNENNLSINTLYRKNPHSIRISIAGKTIDDANGEKQWLGFINDNTYLPTGILITPEKNSAVKDLSKNSLKRLDNIKINDTNPLKLERNLVTVNITNSSSPLIGSNRTTDNTYGVWDLSKPVFAPLNISDADNVVWEENPENQYEIVGYTARGSKLTELEFHMLDNTPDLTSNALVWYSSKGWYKNNKQITSCADIYGGSRQTALDAKGDFIPTQATSGGIRFHTINSDAFSYTVNNEKQEFVTQMPKADSGFYLGFSTSKVFTQNHTGELYFKLELKNKLHTVDTNFQIAYEPNKDTGYITDLAGNRLNAVSSKNPISSIDRIPPNLNISLSPMNQKEIFIVLSKKLQTDINEIVFRDANKHVIDLQVTSSFEEALPYNFKIIKIDENGAVLPYSEDTPKIDTSVKAEVNEIKKKDGKILTSIKLTLDRNVTYEDLRTCYLQIIAPNDKNGNPIKTSYDIITGIKDAQVSFLRDRIGNFMPMYTAAPISKFAINFVNPLYAHNPEIKNDNKSFMDGLYKDGSWAVHDWSRNQQNYGTVYANEAVQVVANVNNGQKDKSNLPQGIVMYIDDSPDKESISKQVNGDLNKDYRIWLPKLNPNYIIPSLSFVNNKDYQTIIANYPSYIKDKIRHYDYSRAFFDIDKELAKMYGPDKQLSFLFALSDTPVTDIATFTPVKIYEKLFIEDVDKYDLTKSIQIPLYCLRLEDASDITSIDLWSYKTRSITKQRGGVSILNNVINPLNGEDTVLQVSVPEDGILNIMVLTLDGNVVRYLHRGQIKSGEYNFYWNGTNENNSEVARGMYFIRVVGTSFDETRKVMVVK